MTWARGSGSLGLGTSRRSLKPSRDAAPRYAKQQREPDLLRHGARKREGGRRALEVILGLLSGAVEAVVALGRGGDRPMPERGRWGAHVERDQEGDHPFLAYNNTPDENLVALHSPVIGDRAGVRNRSRDCEVAGPRDASIRDILTLQGLGGPDRDLATRRFKCRAAHGIR